MRKPMKFVLPALLALSLAQATLAAAADLGTAEEVTVSESLPTWGGLYVGAHAGDSFYDASIADGTGTLFSDSGNEGIAGLYGGYALQLGNVVVGVEVDWSRRFQGDSSDLFTVRGRLGYDLGRMMIYGTAGWGRESFSAAIVDESVSGLVVGGGLEAWLTPRLSLRGEYLYFAPSKLDIAVSGGFPLQTYNFELDYDRSIVRAGLTYHFN